MTTQTKLKSDRHHPLAYSPKGFCDATGLSRPTLYRMMKAGEIAYVKARRRTLIPATELDKLLEGNNRDAQ